MTDSTDISQLPPVDSQSVAHPVQHPVQQFQEQQFQEQPQQQKTQPIPSQQYNPNTPDLQNGPIQSQQSQQSQQPQPSQQPQQIQPHAPQSQPHVPPSEPLSQDIIQQLIEGVQKASSTGATKLSSRDIPHDTTQVTMDEQQHPNHVPGHGPNAQPSIHNQDYIEQYDTMETMLANRKRKDTQEERLNRIYEEFQTPILVVVLFFMFQLPFVSKTFKTYMPNLWVEGKPTLGAYIIQASLFGVSYYGIRQVIQLLSQ